MTAFLDKICPALMSKTILGTNMTNDRVAGQNLPKMSKTIYSANCRMEYSK